MNMKYNYNIPKKGIKIKYLFYILMYFVISKFHLNNIIPENPPIKIILIAAITISGIIILYYNKYNLNYCIFFMIILGISIITKNGELIYTFIVLMALKNFEIESVFKTYLSINIMYFLITIVLNKIGYLESSLYYTSNMLVRNDLGFGNPNRAFLSFYMIWISYLYIKFDNYKIIDRVILIFSAFVMYKITYSRTAFFTIIITLILVEIIKVINIRHFLVRKTISILPIIITIITLVLGFTMNNSIIMNEVLSKRPQLWNLFLTNDLYKINLFGYDNKIIEYMSQGSRLSLDNSYLYVLFKNGIIVSIMLICIYTIMLNVYSKNSKKKDIVIIVSILIYCFAESILTDISTNITLIYVYPLLSCIRFSKSNYI